MTVPKFKVGQLLLDFRWDNQKKIEDEYAIGIIREVVLPANHVIAGIYYWIEWTDNEGDDDIFDEKAVEEYREMYVEFSETCQRELKYNEESGGWYAR